MGKKAIEKDILIFPKIFIEPLTNVRQFVVLKTQRHNSEDGRLYIPKMTATIPPSLHTLLKIWLCHSSHRELGIYVFSLWIWASLGLWWKWGYITVISWRVLQFLPESPGKLSLGINNIIRGPHEEEITASAYWPVTCMSHFKVDSWV